MKKNINRKKGLKDLKEILNFINLFAFLKKVDF